MPKIQFVSMGADDDVLILDPGEGASVLIALADIDRQICINCGSRFSIWNDPSFDFNECRKVMTDVGSCYVREDPNSPDDDFELILLEV
jgi:hypothetical protein